MVIINNHLDYLTKEPYTNTGAIRRDAITHATGDIFCLADDDDIYLPWHVQQGVDELIRTGRKGFKPRSSFFKAPGKLELVKNVMEASVFADIEEVRAAGFNMHSGKESLSWYERLRDCGELNENNFQSIASYAFNWSDPGTHKQSGDIDNPNNFSNHIAKSVDHFTGPLQVEDISRHYQEFYQYFRDNQGKFNPLYFERYIQHYLK